MRALARSGLAAATTGLTRRALERVVPAGDERWTRTNHRGEPVSLLAGPALAAGLLVPPVVGSDQPARARAGHAVAVAGAAAFGLIDDLAEDPVERDKGLRGHLTALRRGRLTTGALKVLGIGTSAALGAVLMTPRGPLRTRAADVVLNTALLAGAANLMNLLDLRPGRALKAGALAASALAPVAPNTAATVLGAGAVAIGPDLAERDMLGDCGANALGAALGAGACAAPRGTRLALTAGIIALTLVSERVSFSSVIDRTPALRALDSLGRRP